MNILYQRICLHMMIPFTFFTLVGGFLLPGWLPPPAPNLPAADMDAIFHNHINLRIGMEMLGVGAAFFLGPTVAWGAQLRRYEGPQHVMADLQIASGVIGTVIIIFAAYIWLAISYRPDTPHALIDVFNDLSWFLFIGGVGSAIMQCVPFAICILGDQRRLNIYPRWMGYMNMWFAIGLVPGVFIPFFQTGPFTWKGLLGFWVVATAFFLWAFMNYIYTVLALNRQVRDEAATLAPADPTNQR